MPGRPLAGAPFFCREGSCRLRRDFERAGGYYALMAREHRTFGQFWPFYLREHSRPRTRALHYVGTTLVVALLIYAVLSGRWWLLLLVPIAGYAFAWIAHFMVEKNRPATFTHPLWSLAADFRMWALWLTGRLGPELKKAGVERTETNGS